IHACGAKVLVLGLSFKENCPDLRNTRVIDVVRELREYGAQVDVHDPWADPRETEEEYGLGLVAEPQPHSYDAVVLAVAHNEFQAMGAERIRSLVREGGVV